MPERGPLEALPLLLTEAAFRALLPNPAGPLPPTLYGRPVEIVQPEPRCYYDGCYLPLAGHPEPPADSYHAAVLARARREAARTERRR